MLELVRTHWRCAVAVAIVGASAFVGGRCTAPERVRVEERVVTEYQDRVQWWGGYTEKRVEGKQTVRIVERKRPAEPAPPGCPTCQAVDEKETTIVKEATTVEASGQAGGTEDTKGRQEAVRVEAPVISRYRVGALVGAQFVPMVFPPPAMVGGHFEMRLGEIPLVRAPVWAGLWSITTPQRFPNPTFGGFSITVELP